MFTDSIAVQNAADAIRTARHRRAWSQAQLAEAAGVPQSSIGRYESRAADPSTESLLRLLHAAKHHLRLAPTADPVELGPAPRYVIQQLSRYAHELVGVVNPGSHGFLLGGKFPAEWSGERDDSERVVDPIDLTDLAAARTAIDDIRDTLLQAERHITDHEQLLDPTRCNDAAAEIWSYRVVVEEVRDRHARLIDTLVPTWKHVEDILTPLLWERGGEDTDRDESLARSIHLALTDARNWVHTNHTQCPWTDTALSAPHPITFAVTPYPQR